MLPPGRRPCHLFKTTGGHLASCTFALKVARLLSSSATTAVTRPRSSAKLDLVLLDRSLLERVMFSMLMPAVWTLALLSDMPGENNRHALQTYF